MSELMTELWRAAHTVESPVDWGPAPTDAIVGMAKDLRELSANRENKEQSQNWTKADEELHRQAVAHLVAHMILLLLRQLLFEKVSVQLFRKKANNIVRTVRFVRQQNENFR